MWETPLSFFFFFFPMLNGVQLVFIGIFVDDTRAPKRFLRLQVHLPPSL